MKKCIKILNENFNHYKDSLFDEDVLRNFMAIVIKTKKFAKPEMKQYLEEWEGKLKTHSEMGLEDEKANKNAEHEKKRIAKRSDRNKKRTTKEDQSIHNDECVSSDDENYTDGKGIELSGKEKRNKTPSTRRKKRILTNVN
jgi:hypothetical protein